MATLSPHEVAVSIESCAYNAVDHVDPWAISRHGVVIGEIAWDNCQCGQLVISETRRYPSLSFPVEEIDSTAECGEPWLVVEYTLSLVRCVPIPDSTGKPPPVDKLTAAAAQNSKDMTDVRRAVYCCLETHYDENEIAAFELNAMDVVGPEGACAGFTLTFRVGWHNGCGCG